MKDIMTMSEPTKKKRKTHTSTAVKARYNAKMYSQIGFHLPKELVAAFKAKCELTGISQASVIKDAIQVFLNESN